METSESSRKIESRSWNCESDENEGSRKSVKTETSFLLSDKYVNLNRSDTTLHVDSNNQLQHVPIDERKKKRSFWSTFILSFTGISLLLGGLVVLAIGSYILFSILESDKT